MGSIPIGARSYRYKSIVRYLFKSKWNLIGKVEDHHVIPKQLQNHPVIQVLKFDINSSKNLVMMPTKHGMQTFWNIRYDRLVHHSGHKKYNSYVEFLLNKVETEQEFEMLHDFLKHNCRFNTNNIPWN